MGLFGGPHDQVTKIIEQDLVKMRKETNDKADARLLKRALRIHWQVEKYLEKTYELSKKDIRVINRAIQHMRSLGIPTTNPTLRQLIFAEQRLVILAKQLAKLNQEAKTNL